MKQERSGQARDMTDRQKLAKLANVRHPLHVRDPFVALKESQFVPFFQPLTTLRTGQLIGFEVLARWLHPTEGIILPNQFIPAAERDGWIGALNCQILPKAFAALSAIADDLTLAINISPLQLHDPNLPDQIRGMAAQTGFSMSRLVVEITESALIDDLTGAAKMVSELKALGCKLALDDFGTGYSSLTHLQSLPFDGLKVDRRFVSSMADKRESRKIVSAVVGLGQSLGLTTIAEGIETQEQAEMMLWLGCEVGQGYFFGRPMPAEHLAASIAACREKIRANNRSPWKVIPTGDPFPQPQRTSLEEETRAGLVQSDAKLQSDLSAAERRNQALLDLEILDAPVEAELIDLVALASEACGTPISSVSFVGSERHWVKVAVGMPASEAPIDVSFCAHAIEQQGLFMVEDAINDIRFMDNPLVLGKPHIRFYAGMPFYTSEGVAVGTLCVIDTVPRSLSAWQAKALTTLTNHVQTRLELRSEKRKLLKFAADNRKLSEQLEVSKEILLETNLRLEQLATEGLMLEVRHVA